MNINIGNNRWVKFTRSPDGEWRGRGHGYRFQVTRVRRDWTMVGDAWRCRVWRDAGGAVIASCRFAKMKSAIHEGARLADAAITPTPEATC